MFSTGTFLYSKWKRVQTESPDVSYNSAVNIKTFDKLIINRKTEPNETALEITRLFILNLPRKSQAENKRFSITFYMNSLWQEYVMAKLKSLHIDCLTKKDQESKLFFGAESRFVLTSFFDGTIKPMS